MKILTRAEEFILLAIWKLQENAYSLEIQKQILKISGKNWSLGTIYAPLERLEKRKLIDSYLSGTTPERGGRQKRIYQVTESGKEALINTRDIQAQFWSEVPALKSESGKT